MEPVVQQDWGVSIIEYLLSYHDRYEYNLNELSHFTQKKVVTSNVKRR